MASRTKSYVTPKHKTKFRVNNWPAYEAGLGKRGDMTVWFDEACADSWNAPSSGTPGGQRRYSDLAIVTTLTLRTVFHLALRQAEGFVGSLIGLMGLDLDTPDHTTLSRRSGAAEVPKIVSSHQGPIHLVIDRGLKILGDGEWHSHKHKTADRRRRWRKLHLGVDAQGFVVASALTDSGQDDATEGVRMIGGLDRAIMRFTADGAYDTRAVYEALAPAGGEPCAIVIPPRKTASPSQPAEELLEQRDAAIARIAEVGRRRWRKESGAHRQARAENAMFRYKRLVGDRLRAKSPESQATEARIAVNVLNRMHGLGTPDSEAVVA